MAYVPDWLPLAGALQRVTSTGVGEEEAKTDLCRAVADRKIVVRVRIASTGKVCSGRNVGVPPHLSACDLDWVKSRPLAQWGIGPVGPENYTWLEGWTKQPLDLIELSTVDVIEVLCGGGDHRVAATEASSRYPGRPGVKPLIISELRARSNEGSLCNTVAEEAKYLLKWVTQEHAGKDGLPTTARVIENQIRDEFRALRRKTE